MRVRKATRQRGNKASRAAWLPGATGGLPPRVFGDRCAVGGTVWRSQAVELPGAMPKAAANGRRRGHVLTPAPDGMPALRLGMAPLVRTNQSVRAAPAFSLAELMIAVVILGLGLLFIAAALPVGLSYTRDTLDLAAGEATSEYALDTIEQSLCTAEYLVYQQGVTWTTVRLDNLFRPRQNVSPNYPLLANDPEPWIKVRPLVMQNIIYGPAGAAPPYQKGDELAYDTENAAIWPWLVFAGMPPTNPMDQYDGAPGALRLGTYPFFPAFPGFPALPSVARVYPPITPDWPFSTAGFFSAPYAGRPVRGPNTPPPLGPGSEAFKALDRRVVWTAFYRRLSYPQPGPDGVFGTPDDIPGDPLLYEAIVVVVRRPSVGHRFPIQDNIAGNPAQPLAATAAGSEVLAPEPWLVTFDPNSPLPPQPPLVPGTDYDATVGGDRAIINVNFAERGTLMFRCSREVGVLLPVGSIFVPAVNDDWPGQNAALRRAGFVPHAPQALPIYEVVERPDEFTVIVKNNGFYPWINLPTGQTVLNWPVWVIPPAFRERDTNGQPVFERRSPILAVARRYIRLREID